MKRIATILLILTISCVSFAQGNKTNRQDGRGNRMKKEQIESMKVAFFTTNINLTTEESEVFWPIYNEYWDKKQTAHRISSRSLKAITRMDEKGEYEADAMKRLLDTYIKNLAEERKVEAEYYEVFCEILSVEKMAKLYITEEKFRMEVINMWRREHRQGNQQNNK